MADRLTGNKIYLLIVYTFTVDVKMEVEEEKTEMSDDTDDSTDGSDEDSSDQSDVEEDAVDDAEAEKKIAQLQKAVMYFTRIIAHLYAS